MVSDLSSEWLCRLGEAPRPVKQAMLLAVDTLALVATVAIVSSLLGAPILRFPLAEGQLVFLTIFIPLGLGVYWAFNVYRMVIRRLDRQALLRMLRAGAALAVLTAAIWAMRTAPDKALALGIVTGGMAVAISGLARIAAHAALTPCGRTGEMGEPLIIYGAGRAGHHLANALSGEPDFRPVAFIDDDPGLQNLRVGSLKVHPAKDLEMLGARHGARRLAIAIPSLSRRRRREIMDHIVSRDFEALSIPAYGELMSGSRAVSDLRKVEIDDLLARDVVDLDQTRTRRWFLGRTVMVTGAGGSIGSELSRQLSALGIARIILFELSEPALYAIHQELLRQKLELDIVPILGSVADRERLEAVFGRYRIDGVFHAAAYKHVPLVEENVLAGAANNVLGTDELADAAGRSGVERFVLISTDKAVRPTNVMGATKRFAELAIGAAQERHPATVYSMVRFGNVLGSSGSVIPLFERQIMRGGPVTVTHPEITRYFMTIPEASQLVITAGLQARGGEVFVLDMGEPVKIIDLARRMIRLSGASVRDRDNPDGDIEIRITGLRPGEKLYEELLIDDNVIATPERKIFCAREETLPADVMQALLSGIRAAISRNDTDGVLAILQEAVPGYARSRDANDVAVSQLPIIARPRDVLATLGLSA